MTEKNEILNIDYHRRRLIIKALTKFKKVEDAAEALQISSRSLYDHMNIYDIKKLRGKILIDGKPIEVSH